MKLRKLFALVIAFVVVLSSFSFVGCSGSKDVMGLKIDEECYVNKTPTIGYSEKNYNDAMENIRKLTELVEKQQSSDLACQILCLLVSSQLYKLIDALNVANLYYYTNTQNQLNQEGYSDLYDKYTVAMNEFKKLYGLFADSRYKTIFYGDISDEEIAELVKKAVSSDELVSLTNKVVELQTRYDGFTNEQKLGADFDGVYKELVVTENSIATEYGYENFMNYSYDMEYSRDFTPSDTLNFVELLSNGVVTTAQSAYENSVDATMALTDERIDELEAILNDSFTTEKSQSVLDGFYRSLGDDIYSIYRHVMKNGYYYIAYGENAYDGAFTNYFVTLNEPFMYFSSAYATVQTFVHEFGHYCRFYLLGNGDESSYELMETHSQGAEWLFMSYLTSSLFEEEKSYLVNDRFVSDSYMILLAAIVGASEVDVYNLESLDGVNFDTIVKKYSDMVLGSTFPAVYSGYIKPDQYFRFVAVNNPGYYISYSVSLIASIDLYVESLTSYNDAVAAYWNILNAQDANYITLLTDNGLGSPFDLATITKICTVFANL